MKTILSVLLLLSLLLNGYFLWDRKQAEKDKVTSNSEWQQRLDNYLAGVKTAGHLINELQAKRAQDSLTFKSREKGLKIEIKRYESKIASLRPQVQAKIDSFPDLRQFLELQDSIIVKQDSLIRAQDLFCAAQISDFNEILALHQQKFTAQQQISEAWMETAAEARKEAVKERKKKNFFKITSGILTAGILFLAVRE